MIETNVKPFLLIAACALADGQTEERRNLRVVVIKLFEEEMFKRENIKKSVLITYEIMIDEATESWEVVKRSLNNRKKDFFLTIFLHFTN
jgi:hypothetical protein